MVTNEPAAIIRLERPDERVLDELKGRLQLQFRSDPAVRKEQEARIVAPPDGKSQSLGGAEAFLLVFGGSAALEATRLVLAEFRARGTNCTMEAVDNKVGVTDKGGQPIQMRPKVND